MKHPYYTLITGASGGFGKALALECARRGMNLILVALPGPALEQLSRFIRQNYHVKVIYREKDLSIEADCRALYEDLQARGLRVRALINNAGLGDSRFFLEEDTRFIEREIQLNVMATTLLTRLFAGELKKHAPSYVLNVSSLSCFFFLPRKAVYGSTKSYVYYFSRSLRKELRPAGISVSVVCPGPLNTDLAHTLMNRFSSPFSRACTLEPETAAVKAIDGMLKGKAVIIPGKMNRLFRFWDRLLPDWLKRKLTNRMMQQLKTPFYEEGFSLLKTPA